jgi:hypothetical protein
VEVCNHRFALLIAEGGGIYKRSFGIGPSVYPRCAAIGSAFARLTMSRNPLANLSRNYLFLLNIFGSWQA